MQIILLLFLIIFITTVLFLRSDVFGVVPKGEHCKQMENSLQFDAESGCFQNRVKDLHREMNQRNFKLSTFYETMVAWKNNTEGVPKLQLPHISPDFNKFKEACSFSKTIWLGHSTFLLNIEGSIILADPVFGPAASPVSFLAKRFQKPVIELSELPMVDLIMISHDHYDHLDMQSIKYFKDKDTKFIVPLGLSSHLIAWGISKQRIQELDWWESFKVNEITFTATPSQHFSGRDAFHSNKTLWCSWVLSSRQSQIFFSGDSGYDTHFKLIGEKYGPFDLALIETGQYDEKWQEVHMLPEQSVQAYKDLKAKAYLPIHWGMFELSIHSWFDPIFRIDKLAQENSINLVTPMLGESIEVTEVMETTKWWEEL